jgi:autotransporter translocation and assembly factor TamB
MSQVSTSRGPRLYSLESLNIQDLASSIQNSYVTVDSLNLAVNGHKVENSGQGRISFADRKLEIENLQFLTSAPQAPLQGSIVASGKISIDKTFDLGFKGEHIHPGLFSSLIKTQEGEGVMDLDLSGDLGFDVRAKGTLDSPNIAFSLVAEDMNIPIPSAKEERKIDRILCRISYAGESLNIEEMNIETSGNDLDINGNIPVRISLMPVAVTPLDQSMDLRMLMDNFDLALLSHLTDEIDEVKGVVKADVRVSGSFKDPRLAGEFNLSDMSCRLMIDNSKLIQAEKTEELQKAARQPLDIEDMNLRITMVDRQIALDNVSFQVGGGKYEARGRIEFGKELEPQLFDLTFKTSPARVDPFLKLVNPELSSLVSGEITVDGKLNGDLRELRGKPIVDTLKAISGEMNILEENIKITAVDHIITNPKSISAKFQDGKFDLASLKLIDKTAEGSGPKPAPTSSITALGVWEIGGTKFFDATVDLDMGLVAALMRQPDFMGGWLAFKIQARGQEIECSWPPSNIVHDQGLTVKYATIDRFEGKVVYRDQEIDVERIDILAGENHIICKGKVPMNGKDMNLRVDARLDDMGILPFLNIEITESSGKGSFGATITGNMKKIMAKEEPVRFAGACRFRDLDVNFDRSYMSFEGLQTDIEFSFGKTVAEPNRGFIALNTLRGKMNDGEIFLNADQTAQAGAEIIWSKETGYRIGELRNLSFTMSNCELYSPGEYSIFLNGDLSLRGRFDAPIVKGDVNLYKGEYTESLEGFIQKLFSSREIGVKAFLEYPLVQDLELDVNVQVPGDMWMRNRIVDVEAKAYAKVRGSLANPIVLAQGSILEGGTFSYFGRKFEITKGEITNRAEIDPEYDIVAVTEISDPGSSSLDASDATTEVTIILKGTLRDPQAPVFQGPPGMNQRDIIALLTLGTTSDAFLNDPLSASSPVLMNSAKRYLEAQAAERLNLTEFQVQVDPNDYKETRVVVARQLMEQISVLVGVGYGSLERIGLQYDVSKRVALAGETNLEGDWDVDLKFMLGK